MSPDQIFYCVLVFSWIEYIWDAYLGGRQRKIYRTRLTVPIELDGILDQETYDKARLYSLDKSFFGGIERTFNQILSTVLMWFYGFKFIWDIGVSTSVILGYTTSHEILHSMLFAFYYSIFSSVIGLPLSLYGTFVIEEKHGFNKQTMSFFIKDKIKKFFLTQLIMLPMVAAVIKIIQWGGDYFILYLWGFILVFSAFMMVVYPEFIAPLFDSYTPLPEGELREKIEELADSIDFPLYKLFVVDGSKRSSHSNAYFYGFFNFKRIVLFDTLLEQAEREKLKSEEEKEKEAAKMKEMTEKEKQAAEEDKKKGCSNQEILAVLAHELGHWKHSHTMKNMIITEIHIFLMFVLFGYLYKQQFLYSAFGFTDSRPLLIGLVIILQFVTAPYNAVLEFGMICLCRKFEFQADAFATGLGKAAHLRTALVKLNNDNLGFPVYDWLFSAWHHSHPPLLERIAVLEGHKKKE